MLISRCHDSVNRTIIFFSFSLLLMMTLHLHLYSVFLRLLSCHHPMQTLISDSFLVISDSLYDSLEP